MKQKIITSLLWTCIVSIFSGVFAFAYETFFGFPSYINGLKNPNMQGLGIIGIIIFGLIACVVLILIGILCLIATAGIKKSKTESKAKNWTVFGIVAQFLLAVGLIAYSVLMLTAYPGGYVGKAVYFSVAIIPIVLGIVNCVRCKKLVTKEEIQTQKEE